MTKSAGLYRRKFRPRSCIAPSYKNERAAAKALAGFPRPSAELAAYKCYRGGYHIGPRAARP